MASNIQKRRDLFTRVIGFNTNGDIVEVVQFPRNSNKKGWKRRQFKMYVQRNYSVNRITLEHGLFSEVLPKHITS